MQPKRKGHIIQKILKVFAWIIVSIISLFLLVLLLIQLPPVQNYGRKKIVTFLEKKIGTPVQIAHLDIDFPKLIVLEGVYFEDQQKDTLLAGKKLRVDISLFKLIKNKVEINEISLDGITAHINRNAIGVFNFDYIINAFASEPKVEDTTSAPMEFALDEINLDKINIRYHDDLMGYDMALALTHFDTDIETFDLEHAKYATDDITLEGLSTTLRQFKPLGEKISQIDSTLTPDTVKPKPMDLTLGDISFSSIKIDYQNEIDSIFAKLNLGKLFIDIDKLNIDQQQVTVNELSLQNTSAGIHLGRKAAAQQVAKVVSNAADSVGKIIQEQGWIVGVKKLSLKNNNLAYDDASSPKIPAGIDFSHLDIKKLFFDAESFHYQADSIAGTINDFSFEEKSGVKINTLETEFLYAKTQAYLKDLYLETPNTKIRRSIVLRYPSIETLTTNIGALQLDADLTGSVIGLKDVAYFVPALGTQPLFKKFPDAKLRADVVLRGSINNLLIPELELTGLKNTHVKLTGRIFQATDVNRLYADLNIADISTTDIDIYSLAPKGSLPENIRIPATIALQGSIKGNMQKMQTDLRLRSSFGNAAIKATASGLADSIRATYAADIILDQFNVGKLLKQEDQFGKVSLVANAKGTGYTPSRMNASANGTITSAEIKNYNYRNLQFNATGARGLYELQADIDDPNIDLDLHATADLNRANPAIKALVTIDSIALKPLHFSETDTRIHTKIAADIPNLNIDDLQGKVMITELLVNTGTNRFVSDTITIDALRTDTGNAIYVTSPILVAGLSGKYTFTGIGTSLQQIINRYYSIAPPVTATNIPPQRADFYVKIYSSDFLKELMPQLSLSDSVVINGSLNSSASSIILNGTIPSLTYGTNQVKKATVALNTTDSAIQYAVNIDQFTGSAFKVPTAQLNGSVANNTIAYNLSVKDDDQNEKYLVAGSMLQKDSNYRFHLLPGELKIDYDDWTVNPNNSLEFGKSGIRATDFQISNGDQSLYIQSQTPVYNAPLTARFTNFKIESLTKIAEKDSLYMGGTINGNATVTNLNATPLFEADLTVNNFNYKKDTLGDIVIKANNKTSDSYTVSVAITGNGNSFTANGNYYTSGNMDFDVNIAKLNLASIESFTQGNLRRMTGLAEGRLKVTGTAKSPKVIGDIDFRDAAVNVAMLNALFRMENERISFREDGIHFDDFMIKDSSNNPAIISGAVYTTDYTRYRFNIDLDADDFQVVNSTRKDNPLYYGILIIDTKIKVRGDMDKPEIDADITVNDKTNMTIILPQTDAQVAAREGIVEFIDQDNPQLDSMLLAQIDTLSQSRIKGLDVVANLEIDKNAQFSLIIDEANGDFVRMKGEGHLSGGIDPSGKISLTGTYEINEGAYEMSFNFLRRKFTIQKGSTLTWMGEPTSANLDVTAVYVANAAPIDLVEQQLTDASATIKNTYKQKLPFNVLLIMKGELLKPDLTFDIILPEKNYTVSSDIVEVSNTRLEQVRQDPAELNKQVFALLLLNRFVSENPFESSGGSTSATTLAKQSVSKLLAEQLNKLAADLVAGVDINFGLETTQDYTSGSQKDRTDLNIGVSKQLLNERLKVSVGSNFELEGPTQSNQKTSSIAGNIQVDYKLSKDGGLLLRGFRVDQYEVALQGQVVETGLSFIISVDYDKFSEIFGRRKERKLVKKQVKEERKELQLGTDENYKKD